MANSQYRGKQKLGSHGAPLFPSPQNRLQQVSRSSAPEGSARGDTFSVPPAWRRQGCARMYWRRTWCQTTRAPGFAQAHLPSRRALELIATLRSLPNCRFELHPARPDALLAQQHNGLSLTCRFCSSYSYRRLSPQPGARPQPQLKKTKLLAAHQPASPHPKTRKEAGQNRIARAPSAANSTVVIPRLVFSLFIS
jgi:hypothetical protein